MISVSGGAGGLAHVHKCEGFIEEVKHLFAQREKYCRPHRVSRPYFEGQSGEKGFLWDFFESIRELGLGDALKNLKPKLDPSGNLPYAQYFSKWIECDAKILESLAGIHSRFEEDRGPKERMDPAFRHVSRYFEGLDENPAQRAEAGRFILLISEGCSILSLLKKKMSETGLSLLKELGALVDPRTGGPTHPHHPFHSLVQSCWKSLNDGLKQENLPFQEYEDFMNCLIEDRKKHLASWMALLSKIKPENLAPIQEIQLHLEVQSHWVEMDLNEDVQGLKSHEAFCRFQDEFHRGLYLRLESFTAFTKKLENEIGSRSVISLGFLTILEGVLSLLEKCSMLKSRLPRSLEESLSRSHRLVLRSLHQLKNYLQEQRKLLKGWPPLALARFSFLEMETVRVFFRSNEREILCWGRCLPYLHKSIENDFLQSNTEISLSLKEVFEELLSSTSRVLRQKAQA